MSYSWGPAFSDSFTKGLGAGQAIKKNIAQRDYSEKTKAIDLEEAEDKEAQDTIRQAKLDELNNPEGKYASMSAEDKQKAIAEMDKLRDQGYSEATRDSNVGRKQAMVDYYGAIGDVANADKTKTELQQAQWSQKFWDGLKDNSAAYDDQMIADLNTDTIAKVQGIQYAKDKSGNLVMTQNGKMIGQPVQITDQMRAPFLQNMYSTQFNREFGTAPTQQDATAWTAKKTAIGSALSENRKQAETERFHREYTQALRERNAGKGATTSPTGKTNWTKTELGNDKITSNNPEDHGRLLGWSIGNIQVPGSVPTEEAAIKVADDLKKLSDMYGNFGSLQNTANGTKFVLNDGSAFFDNINQFQTWQKKERTGNPKGTSVTARKKKGQQSARQAVKLQKQEETKKKVNQAFDPNNISGGTD